MSPQRSAARGCGGQCRILLVDDDESLLRGLKLALAHEGYCVSTASSGAAALELMAKKHPHLVVLDVMMPGMDGMEVLRRIRTNPASQDVAVMMLTAKDSDEAKIVGFGYGADDYLSKAVSLDELRCRVEALLRRTVAREEAPVGSPRVPVTLGAGGEMLIDAGEIFYFEGVRNYSYVHTFDARFLSRLSLMSVDGTMPPQFMRIHRSHTVNLDHVRIGRWATRSQYRVQLADQAHTELAVSRNSVAELQHRLGLR
jgi:DNA-binding response OmpR family regulator